MELEKLGGGKNGCILLFMLYPPPDDLSDLVSLEDFEAMLPCPMSFIRLCGLDLLMPILSGPSWEVTVMFGKLGGSSRGIGAGSLGLWSGTEQFLALP